MSTASIDSLLESATNGRQIGRAAVVAVHPDGSVSVAGAGADELRCDVLVTGSSLSEPLALGQAVLVWHPEGPGMRGVILGRIGTAVPAVLPAAADEVAHPPLTSTLPISRAVDDAGEVPDAIVLEARHSLTLRVGDGSITLREDGRILIKGRDLVSSAQRLNRIKGGAVSIN